LKLQIEESTAAEFDELSPAEFGAKLHKALRAMLPSVLVEALGDDLNKGAPSADPSASPSCSCGSCGDDALLKASDVEPRPRGGEIQLIDDLSQMLLGAYEVTTGRMLKSLEAQALRAAEDGEGRAKGARLEGAQVEGALK